jgi:DNA invertase Pin-like site-specific DNA recombinase
LAAVTDRRAAGLIVVRRDVLATGVILQEAILALVLDHDGEVFTCDRGPIDGDDRGRSTLRQAFRTFARLDREVRAAHSRARRQRKRARGGYIGGAPAFGYRAEARQLVVEASEQAALARIDELRRTGASLRAIARILSAEGYRPKRSDRWHPESLRRIIGRLPADSPGADRQ